MVVPEGGHQWLNPGGRGFRDRIHAFTDTGVEVGASFDHPAQNKVFAEARQLPFRLLSDVDRKVGDAYEVLRDPANPTEGGARRITYLIDPRGRIRRSFPVGDIDAHPDEVLAALQDPGPGDGSGAAG